MPDSGRSAGAIVAAVGVAGLALSRPCPPLQPRGGPATAAVLAVALGARIVALAARAVLASPTRRAGSHMH